MKITTQEFLDHLGIEVGKPFVCDGEKLYVKEDKYTDGQVGTFTFNEDGLYSGIGYLLDKEITPLPKYTLTEDEKDLIKDAPSYFSFLENDEGIIYLVGSERARLYGRSLFKWIQKNTQVSLDELRKCL